MSMIAAEFDRIFGSAFHVNQNEIRTFLVHTTFAGDPTSNVVPNHVGQICHDTTNDDWYIAHGTANTNWKIFAT